MTNPHSEAQSGNLLDLVNPQPESIFMPDIVCGLARAPRFTGQTTTERTYTVAQHSVLVALIVERYLKGAPATVHKALLHDAHEAYTGDISTPIKRLIPELSALCNRIQAAIHIALHVEPPTPEEAAMIHLADATALALEAFEFMPSRGNDWGHTEQALDLGCEVIGDGHHLPWPPTVADEFQARTMFHRALYASVYRPGEMRSAWTSFHVQPAPADRSHNPPTGEVIIYPWGEQ